MTDLDEWKNFQDYEDFNGVNEESTEDFNPLIIFGICATIVLGLLVLLVFLCRKMGTPITWQDIILSLRRQLSELRAWVTGGEIETVFNPTVIEERENSASKCYSSLPEDLRYSWPLMSVHESCDNQDHHLSSTSL